MIHATDAAGTPVATQFTGSFDVAAPANGGPAISNIVVSQSGATPVITWSVQDGDGIAATSVEIDGQVVATVYGPYGTKYSANYAGALAGLAAGTHNYVIHATDAAATPNSTQTSGTFELTASQSPQGPVFSNIVIAELNGNGDGIIQSNEKIVVTWTLTDPDGIFSTGATLDNSPVQKLYGPYGSNWSAVIDPLTAGSHPLILRAADNSAAHTQSTYTSTISVATASLLSNTKLASAKADWLFDYGTVNTPPTSKDKNQQPGGRRVCQRILIPSDGRRLSSPGRYSPWANRRGGSPPSSFLFLPIPTAQCKRSRGGRGLVHFSAN